MNWWCIVVKQCINNAFAFIYFSVTLIVPLEVNCAAQVINEKVIYVSVENTILYFNKHVLANIILALLITVSSNTSSQFALELQLINIV